MSDTVLWILIYICAAGLGHEIAYIILLMQGRKRKNKEGNE